MGSVEIPAAQVEQWGFLDEFILNGKPPIRLHQNVSPNIYQMKNVIVFGILLSLLTLVACKKDDGNDDSLNVSECMEQTITDFANSVDTSPSNAYVKEYEFQHEKVYLFNLGLCLEDEASLILDAQCDTVCYVGGFVMPHDCRGEHFFDNATELRTVWEN